MELKQAILVLSDISGYTRFLRLHTMSLLHAEKIVTDLTEAIIETTRAPLKLNKLEGDAILFYAETEGDEAATADAVLQQVRDYFEAFTRRSKELTGCNNLCPCEACRQADQLRLKTVLHCGEIVLKTVRNFEEVAGEAVIVTHRLLKNSLSRREYVLMTRPFAELSGAAGLEDTESRTEEYEDLGSIPIEVWYPQSAEAEEEGGKRNVVATVGNALRLDGYSFARVLGLKGRPERIGNRSPERPSLGRFLVDCVSSLGMVIRRKVAGAGSRDTNRS